MALYCYSPTLATVLNLMLLTICAIVFGWVWRRTAYYRYLIIGPMLEWLLPAWFAQRGNRFTAFSVHSVDGLPSYIPFTIQQISQTEFEVRGRWLWRSFVYRFHNARVQRESSLLVDHLRLIDAKYDMTFSHRRGSSAVFINSAPQAR